MEEKQMSGFMVLVNIESAWASKINWTQAVAAVAALLVVFSAGALNIAPETQVGIVTGITFIQGIVTWYFKTFQTTSITASSATSTPVSEPPVIVAPVIAAQILAAGAEEPKA